ncbi:MAG: chorismate synthase [Ignavibacteriae bacterium]|nr:chorismate synthase [Ignavibacteria bacterium]MBI3364496.1 chorismate synthase [Ignavibacteriota bacterium]
MAGNALGSFFRITTFGESHGKAVGVLIDGVKPNMIVSEAEIQKELDRRRPGQSSVTTSRNEADQVHILSGVFEGKTLGTPLCLLIWNKDQNSKAYDAIKDLFRPGHAGYTYLSKYGIQDYRGGGRSSARETAGRVAAGALAKHILARRGIRIIAYTKEVGGIVAKKIDYDQIEKNPVRCPDREAADRMAKKILRVKNEGDSLGGIVEAIIQNCPSGLGDPVFDKLEADLAKALMSIPAIKGFEIGSGFAAARMRGSEHNDEFIKDRKTGKIHTKTNYAGGILGGISNGEDIVVRVVVKPPSSIPKAQHTVDVKGRARTIKVEGRHDPCLCPRAVPVVESMIALVIADHLMRQQMLKNNGNPLSRLRKEIDFTDDMIMMLLSERQELVREVGRRKKKHRLPIPNRKREEDILTKRLALAGEANLDDKLVEVIYRAIFDNARRIQKVV